jgi:hypothetical protein
MSMQLRIILSAIPFAVAGCANPFVSDWKEEVAYVVELEPGDFLLLPEEAAVGADVQVQLRTGGSPDCTRIGHTRLQWETATSLVITPFNDSREGRATCNYSQKFLHHNVTVRFPTAGTYLVRVQARSGQREAVTIVASETVAVH